MDNQNTQLNTPINVQPRRWFSPKIIFIILGLIVAVELVFGLYSLISSTRQKSLPQPTKLPTVSSAKVSLLTTSPSFKVGDKVPVTVNLNTGGHNVAGADVILHFDPKILEASGSSIFTGKAFPNYPKMEVDQKSGLVALSGISLLDKDNFAESGVLAVVQFKAKTPGSTKISLDFTPGATSGTNVIDAVTGQNILSSVLDLSLTIK